jgi:hypothetical protein
VANICATADKSLLLDFIPLGTPLNLLGADATVTGMLCPGYGFYPMMFTDGTVAHIHMYYCPQLSEILISPQHICTLNTNSFAGFDIQCRDMDNSYVCFYKSPDFSSFSDAPLTHKTIYFTSLSYLCNHKQIGCPLYLILSCGTNALVIQVCINFVTYKSALLAFLVNYINKSIHFTIAKSAVMLKPPKTHGTYNFC